MRKQNSDFLAFFCNIQCKIYQNNLHRLAPLIICILLAFFSRKSIFLYIKKIKKKLTIKISAICYNFHEFVFNIYYYRLYDLKI